MQFVTNGPDIPDALLQAHEEGRVVFFCGAGISYPAGLPGFKELVEKIYRLAGTDFSVIEREAFDQGRFDSTLSLLEQRLPGQRLAVRRALAQALKPKLRRKGATDTQAAILSLARSQQGTLRLVTTNFDRVFHSAAKRTNQTFQSYAAPMLPIPKSSRWNGLVYLHGLLPEKIDDTALNRLIVTSGDFGLAYLTERWAARFVSELFRNYVVCFVGYSINDPVLRYMMDALAADRMLGEVTPQAWALGDCEPGNEYHKTVEWESKGVTPILYEVPIGSHDHSALHKTLHAWAETYRDGVIGKEHIVVTHALAQPSASSQQDNFVGRMLWALSDKEGLAAKRFADFNPAPSLDWLFDVFTENQFKHADLSRFKVPPNTDIDDKLRFGLIHRPAPYTRAPWMSLVLDGITSSELDKVMFQLARWLVRHLNDPKLVIWVAKQGGQIHEQWRWLIEQQIDRFADLERENKTSELEEIHRNAPNAIPDPFKRKLWQLILCGRVKSWRHEQNYYSWMGRLKRHGLTTSLRMELRELLAAKVVLKEPFRWSAEFDSSDQPITIEQQVDREWVLTTDDINPALRDFAGDNWSSALPSLLDDFQQLLRDALDLMHELGDADEQHDQSRWALPSISPHWQNRGFHDWVSLIELLRDAWLAVRPIDTAQATRIARAWFDIPYPTFKRLAFFAASQDGCIVPEEWVDWLLTDDAWWLWSRDLHRETMRLLALQGKHISGQPQQRLEHAILQGPPRAEYVDDLEEDRWQRYKNQDIWLRLAKLAVSGLILGNEARQQLDALSAAYPEWQFEPHEREEFLSWMSGTGDPDYEESHDRGSFTILRKRHEIMQWLIDVQAEWQSDDEYLWRKICDKHPLNSLFALNDLAMKKNWLTRCWHVSLYSWSNSKKIKRIWRCAAPLVQKLPDTVIQEITDEVTWWIETASKSVDQHEDILFDLCYRILALPLNASTGMTSNGTPIDEPFSEAINHPVGHITRALINLWFKRKPNDNDQLPTDIKTFFTMLSDIQVDRFRHGRVLLGSQLIALFRVDRTWTEQYLLPLLNWNNPAEAKAVWEGFFRSPRRYPPLMIAFKPAFLECAHHYADLSEHSRHFAAFLTYAALDQTEGYSPTEFRSAFAALPKDGLEQAAQALYQTLEAAAEQREEFWSNRVQPFWNSVWPQSRELVTPRIAQSMARLCIAAGSEFPAALTAIQHWLQPIEHPEYSVELLHKSGLCRQFPMDALSLLDALINNQQWIPQELRPCLDEIAQTAPELAHDPRLQRLRDYSRRRD